MSSFCLGEIYEKNQSGAERLLLFYKKLRRRNCQKGKEMETIISACLSGSFYFEKNQRKEDKE